MDITTRKLNKSELALVRQVANVVWPITFSPILSQEQIAYMMKMMYAPEVMEREYDEGIQFHGVFDHEAPIGYYIWGPYKEDTAKLHKCYLLPDYQGKGIGSRMLQETIAIAQKAGFTTLCLNVNRNNTKAINAYLRNGFHIAQSVDNPIGNGFFMNDYIMEVKLSLCSPGG